MEMSIDNAKSALANPPAELKELLTDERVPQEARDGLKAAGLDAEGLKEQELEKKEEGNQVTSRLQVVDEHQNFSYVWKMCCPSCQGLADNSGTRVKQEPSEVLDKVGSSGQGFRIRCRCSFW